MVKNTLPFIILMVFASCNEATQLNFRAPSMYEEKEAREDYAVEMQLGDRPYVESVLMQVFDAQGTSAESYIKSDILRRVEFGGACDPYSPSDLGSATVEFPDEQCYTGIGVVLPPNNNPMRYSLTTKVCERLVQDSARMNAVRAKVFSDNKWAPADEATLKKAWSLFYTTKKPDENVIIALKELAHLGSGAEDGWKNVIVTLCISPEWQLL